VEGRPDEVAFSLSGSKRRNNIREGERQREREMHTAKKVIKTFWHSGLDMYPGVQSLDIASKTTSCGFVVLFLFYQHVISTSSASKLLMDIWTYSLHFLLLQVQHRSSLNIALWSRAFAWVHQRVVNFTFFLFLFFRIDQQLYSPGANPRTDCQSITGNLELSINLHTTHFGLWEETCKLHRSGVQTATTMLPHY